MMPRIYLPDQVHLRSGRIVPRGHRDAEMLGDGRAVIRVKRFLLGDSLKRYNEDLQERWTRPAGDTAGIVLLSHEYQLAGETIEHPIDSLIQVQVGERRKPIPLTNPTATVGTVGENGRWIGNHELITGPMAAPRLNTTNQLTGRSSELHVVAELTFLGIPAFWTENPFTRADLLIEVAEEVKRLQVKTMMWRGDRNYFFARPERRDRKEYGSTVDFFVFFCREENAYFVVPYAEAVKVSEVTWTPEHLRQNSGGAHRKVDLDTFKGAWHLLLPDEISEWREERIERCNGHSL